MGTTPNKNHVSPKQRDSDILPAPNQLWDTLACGPPSLPVSTSLSLASHRGMATKMTTEPKRRSSKLTTTKKKIHLTTLLSCGQNFRVKTFSFSACLKRKQVGILWVFYHYPHLHLMTSFSIDLIII